MSLTGQAVNPGPEMAPAPGRRSITRGTVVIAIDRCKGCELCIPACPPGVLAMSVEGNHLGYLYPELSPGCTGCTACQQVCPDFVFEVYRYHDPIIADMEEETAK